jgi:ABC-type branched-subunit amino acid transport system substrate-binding protein
MDRRTSLIGIAGTASLGSMGVAAGAAAPVRVGQSLPLTGPLSTVVKPIVEGQRALLDEVNAEGGVRGAPVELITLDDETQPQKTADNTRRLIENDQVVALFGYAFVPGLLRALPFMNERRVPLIGIYNGADAVRSPSNQYLYTTTASLSDEVTAMVRTLSTLSSRRLALVYQNNELGRFMLPIVQALVQKHGAELVCTVPAEPDGSNGAAAAQTVAAQRPHAILLLAAGAALLSFMKSLPADARVPIYALSLAGSSAVIDQMGPAARGMAFTQVVPHPERPTLPITRRFLALMAKARLAPTYDRMWGFLNTSILVEVLRRAGANPTPAILTATLDHMGDVDLGGYRLVYNANRHHGSTFVDITMVDRDGKFIR